MEDGRADARDSGGDTPAMTGPRIFVTLVFVVLGLSFIAQSALVVAEYREFDWQAMLLLHSHLFVFFPTLGVVALIAFHLPATVFTHMYWTYVPHGRVRFVFGTFVVVVLTLALTTKVIVSYPAELWEIRAPVWRSAATLWGGQDVGIPLLEGVNEPAPFGQVGEQGRDGAIDHGQAIVHAGFQVPVMVPAAEMDRDKC